MKSDQLLGVARALRQQGYSFAEISTELKIAKSTASLWARDVFLDASAKQRLHTRFLIGQAASRAIQDKTYQEKLVIIRQSEQEYLNTISEIPSRLLCALIYWCEGAKGTSKVCFTNADPQLIATFLRLFRSSFMVDESKLRVLMHLHEYHDEQTQKEFWSNVTDIPQTLFSKTYLKPHTGKVKKPGYPGCIHVSYHDARVAKQLLFLAESFMELNLGV
jgi:hypothetical protein